MLENMSANMDPCTHPSEPRHFQLETYQLSHGYMGKKWLQMQQKNDVISKSQVGDISVVSLQKLLWQLVSCWRHIAKKWCDKQVSSWRHISCLTDTWGKNGCRCNKKWCDKRVSSWRHISCLTAKIVVTTCLLLETYRKKMMWQASF